MDLLFISDLYPPEVLSGYDLVCHQVATELRKRGHRVRILCGRQSQLQYPSDGKSEVSRALQLAAYHEDDAVAREMTLRTDKFNYTHVLETLNDSRAPKVDLVVCWNLKKLSLAPIYAAKKAKIPVTYVLHDKHIVSFAPETSISRLDSLKRWAHRWLPNFRSFENLEDLPLILNSRAQHHFLGSRGIHTDSNYVAPGGLPLGRFPYKPSRRHIGEAWKLLYVGPVTWGMGLETLIEAAALLCHCSHPVPLDLTFVGTSERGFRQQIMKRAKKQGFAHRLNFVGNLPSFALTHTFHQNHITVFTAFEDSPFGQTQLQAMACGSALVSTETGRSAERLSDGQNALTYPLGSATGLARQLARLTHDEIFRLALSSRARQYVEHHGSFDSYVDELQDTLQHITAEFHRKRTNHKHFTASLAPFENDDSDNIELISLN